VGDRFPKPDRAAGFGASPHLVSSNMMDESPSYGSWIAEALGPQLRGRVLELGCGSGVYTQDYLRCRGVEAITAMDISAEALELARARVSDPRVELRLGAAEQLEEGAYDSIVCANVAEHVEHEGPFFDALYRALRPAGSLALLVPAHAWLYSRFDFEVGHFRRYSRTMLRRSLAATPFRLQRLFYFNALGAIGWFYAFKLRQRRVVREDASRVMVRTFEKLVLPVGRRIERRVSPPFGLSLVAFCDRPG
jgi:SAM-dependent methyltransferase